MKKIILSTLFALTTIGCSHTIKIKGSRFVPPMVAEKQWSGNVSASLGADTRITLVDDIESNPPVRGPVVINQDVDAADVFGLNYLGVEAGLTVYKAFEVYLDSSVLGIRWQFLNKDKWVATAQIGAATDSESSAYEDESGSDKAESTIDRSQAAVSLGYKANDKIVPYLSYLRETYNVETNVTNTSGKFGPYKDKGNHQYIALGLMSTGTGFLYGIEYNVILIDWDRAEDTETQNAFGIKLGYAW